MNIIVSFFIIGITLFSKGVDSENAVHKIEGIYGPLAEVSGGLEKTINWKKEGHLIPQGPNRFSCDMEKTNTCEVADMIFTVQKKEIINVDRKKDSKLGYIFQFNVVDIHNTTNYLDARTSSPATGFMVLCKSFIWGLGIGASIRGIIHCWHIRAYVCSRCRKKNQ